MLDYRFGYNSRGNNIGFSPFFTEPSHFAQYIIPCICLLLNDKIEHHFRFSKLVFLILGIFISTSSFGLLLVAILLFIYIIRSKDTFKYFILKCFLILIPFLLIVVFSTGLYLKIYYVLNTIFSAFSLSDQKSTYRLYRGIAYYYQMNYSDKIFGIGFGN